VNPRESELRYPTATAPAPGTVTTLRPGLHWLRMPLPFALDHINLWLLDDEIDGRCGFTIIDCGIASEATRGHWEQIFDSVFAGLPLLRLIATHFHPDHFGLAHWLCHGGERRRWSAPLSMTATEYLTGRWLSSLTGEAGRLAGERAAAHFASHGLTDTDALVKVRERGAAYYPKLVPQVPEQYRRLHDRDEIAIGPRGARRRWRVLVGRGHAPEHVSLLCEDERLLIAGDMVLPRISTNVSVFEVEPEGNPLPQYLHSIDQMLQMPADTLVLPSHGLPFVGLHERIGQQHAHHRERLDEVAAACAAPKSAAEIVPVLFKRSLDLHQTTFALGESIAHLHALWYEGRLARRHEDGVYRFSAAA
jgi:glyoxylase-like metal-dependent hydrolase (beta-lactamase superfamily II)